LNPLGNIPESALMSPGIVVVSQLIRANNSSVEVNETVGRLRRVLNFDAGLRNILHSCSGNVHDGTRANPVPSW
jgi:hypothetical protein